MNRITLVIPAKNEEKSLPYVLDEIKNIKCKKLIVVTNINKKILKLKKIYKFDLILQNKNGYGSAIIEGIKNVNTKYLCIYNADGSFDPNTLNKMYSITKIGEKKFVFASRYEGRGGSLDDTFLTYIGNKIFTFIGNIFFKLKLSDILFTYVMGLTKNFNKLNLQSQDFRLCVELPIKIKKKNFLIITTSSYERRRVAGIKNVNEFRDGFLILLYLLKEFFKKK